MLYTLRLKSLLITALLVVGVAYCWPSFASNQSPDVRVLIDVSGSMKKNDPSKARAEALRMLIKLLPDDGVAGIWMFADKPEQLIAVGRSDQAFKRKALAATHKIHARGRYTDVGQAVLTATEGWDTRPYRPRVLILLTDGLVDIEEGADETIKARTKILSDKLASLRQQDVKVYTIALSKQADLELLEQLALQTGGFYQEVNSAKELDKTFLNLFQTAAPQNSLAIEKSKFKVDDGVEVINLLLFQDPKAKGEVYLKLPDHRLLYEKRNYHNVIWHKEGAFDLVTIELPEPGEWQVMGRSSPDDRAFIVSHIRLNLPEFPRNAFRGEQLTLQANLSEDGDVIIMPEFLNMVDMQAEYGLANKRFKQWRLKPERRSNGRYTGDFIHKIEIVGAAGVHEMSVAAKTKVFERHLRKNINVYDSPVTIKTNIIKNHEAYKVVLIPKAELVQADTLEIKAIVFDPDNKKEEFILNKKGKGWTLHLSELMPGERYKIVFFIAGKMHSGRTFIVKSDIMQVARPDFHLTPYFKRKVENSVDAQSKTLLAMRSMQKQFYQRQGVMVSDYLPSLTVVINVKKVPVQPKLATVDEEDKDKADKTLMGVLLPAAIVTSLLVFAGLSVVLVIFVRRKKRLRGLKERIEDGSD